MRKIKMLKQIFCKFILAMVNFFGWTTGVILAVQFCENPVHTTFVIKEVVLNLLPTVIVGLNTLILVAQVTKKKETTQNVVE